MLGIVSSCLLIVQLPDLRYTAYLAIAIWAFCRAYYFAFYVIQHYIDPRYRFSGLLDFARYAMFGYPADHSDAEQ